MPENAAPHTFQSILGKFRRESYSEREKGARFERLMRDYLLTDPYYADRFKTVWLWIDFPYRAALGGQDTGIDIVALTMQGGYWAIQCKCYQESAVIGKSEVDGFLATAGRSFMDDSGRTKKFEHCLWISTTNNWGHNAEETIRNHIPAVSRLSLHHLQNSSVDWGKLARGLFGDESRAPKHAPQPHQNDAITAAAKHFASADRGQLIMACGTGKTFTALKIAEQQAEKTVLFLVPSIALLSQTLGEWLAHAERPIHPICVCSDPEVSRRKNKDEDTGGVSVVDLALPASTDVQSIVARVNAALNYELQNNYELRITNYENAGDAPALHSYIPFEGICLTDTFQLGETDGTFVDKIFPINSARVDAQRKAPLMVIIGNPPYSVGQKSANDNAQNQSYLKLEKRIEETYAVNSDATLKTALYDSYIKAFRWSSDRLDPKNGGIICFVSNGAWLDGNSTGGFRHCLEKEFSSIYVFNLRGNQRTSGELSRREGGKIFGSGSRTPINITLLVKKPGYNGKAVIYYCDIGDYLNRNEKLAKIRSLRDVSNPEMNWTVLTPNVHNDWLNQRSDVFTDLIPLVPETKFDARAKSIFITYSNGMKTNRDAWLYGFSKESLNTTVDGMVNFYNRQLKTEDDTVNDPTKISWTVNLRKEFERKIPLQKDGVFLQCMYRPFSEQHLYFDKHLIERPGMWTKFYPAPQIKNLAICVDVGGTENDYFCLITDKIPDLHFVGDTQCFPLYWYEEIQEKQTLFDLAAETPEDYYARRDGISDHILTLARKLYGQKTSKEDVFYYVYALLHHPGYRKTFSADLKKMLPRIPLVEESSSFWQFVKSGRALADLHLNYEDHADGAAKLGVLVDGAEHGDFTVNKMRFAKTQGAQASSPAGYEKRGQDARAPLDGCIHPKSQIIYNNRITISNIPLDAYDYVVNGKSAIEWIMERYAVTTHKESGIVNDPNDWARERNRPGYILDLLLSVIALSARTVEIINTLPKLDLHLVDKGEN